MLTKLYGRGAIIMNDDRRQYMMMNGVIELPDHLVNRGLSMGLQRHPLPSLVADEPVAVAPAALGVSAQAPALMEAVGTISIDGLGRWSALAEGPIGTQSFRYAYDTGAAPPDDLVAAVGIIVNASTFLADSGEDEHLANGESIYVTIVPFPEREAQGQPGSAIRLVGRVMAPAMQQIDLPGGHPQVALGAAAAARAHEDSATVGLE